MRWLWIVLGILFALYISFRLFVWYFGNWRKTLNSVIVQFVAVSMEYPEDDFPYWYWYTIESRYPLVLSGYRRELYDRKEQLKTATAQIVYAEDETPEHALLHETTLPSLILFCLIVEGNNFVKSRRTLQAAYSQIADEVKKYGFGNYC